MEGIWLVAFVVQWVILLLLAVLMVGVLRYLGFVQRNIHLVTQYASRFEEGDRLDRFELSDLNGLSIRSESLLNINQKTLLFFLNTGCSGCDAVVNRIVDLAKQEGGLKKFEWSFVLIYMGSHTSVKAHIASLTLDEAIMLIDEEGTLLHQYDIRTFPVMIAVDDRGKVIDQKLGNDISKWFANNLKGSSSLQMSDILR